MSIFFSINSCEHFLIFKEILAQRKMMRVFRPSRKSITSGSLSSVLNFHRKKKNTHANTYKTHPHISTPSVDQEFALSLIEHREGWKCLGSFFSLILRVRAQHRSFCGRI